MTSRVSVQLKAQGVNSFWKNEELRQPDSKTRICSRHNTEQIRLKIRLRWWCLFLLLFPICLSIILCHMSIWYYLQIGNIINIPSENNHSIRFLSGWKSLSNLYAFLHARTNEFLGCFTSRSTIEICLCETQPSWQWWANNRSLHSSLLKCQLCG